MKTLDIMKKYKVIAVIRADNGTKAKELAEACIDGGLRLIEITSSFSGLEGVIADISKNKDVLVGAGTVLDVDMARRAIDSGAQFIVSPHTDRKIIKFVKSRKMVVISGALSSSEIVNAWNFGADMVKIFPIKSVGGPSYIKAIKDTLPFIEIMTTGGVSIDNFIEFLEEGASLVGISSDLIGGDDLFDYRTTCKRARRIFEKLPNFDK